MFELKTHSLTVQELDEDSAVGLSRIEERNSEIDAGIDNIARGIDNLASISATIKDEVHRVVFSTIRGIIFY